MKKYFQEASETFRKNKGIFLQIGLVLGLMIGLSTFVGTGLVPGTIILFVFLLLPLLVSIFALAMRAGDNREVQNRDIYFGYKNFLTSIFLSTKILVKPLLMAILVWLLVSFSGYSVCLFVLKQAGDPVIDVILSGDFMAMSNALTELIYTNPWFMLVSYLSMSIAFIVGFNIFIRRSFAPFVCFETTFTLDSAKKLSINMAKKSKGYIMMNNIFMVIYLCLFICMQLLSRLFMEFDTNFLILYLVDTVVISIIMAPLLIFNSMVMFHYYDDNHRFSVKDLYTQYLNVAMRTTDSNIINEQIKKDKEEREAQKKKDEEDKGK